MRFRIIKITYDDGHIQFKIKSRGLIFWYNHENFLDEIEYFDTYDEAFDKVKELAKDEMRRTKVDVEIVYEGEGKQ